MSAIETAATTLVLEHGYDAVTVDQICAHADISKRTFFNYVASKEVAVVGVTPETVPEDVRARFLSDAGPDVAAAALGVLLDSFARARSGDGPHTVSMVQRRRAIVRGNPELGAARMTASSRFQLALVDLVSGLLERDHTLRRLDGVAVEDEARAVVALAVASANLGVSTWLQQETASIDDLDDCCVAALGQLTRLVVAHSPSTPRST